MNYSQWGEDEIITKFFANHPPGRFLDLGANDGFKGSNTRALSDRGWSGVCVEAGAKAFCELLENHRDNPKITCVNAAITASTNRLLPFYGCDESQIGTTYHEHKLGDLVRRHWMVATITPMDLHHEFGPSFEFVSIDIEGSDLPVIEDLGPVLRDTELICFEDRIPNLDFDQVYYDKLLLAWHQYGFQKVVGRTQTKDGLPSNTLLARQ